MKRIKPKFMYVFVIAIFLSTLFYTDVTSAYFPGKSEKDGNQKSEEYQKPEKDRLVSISRRLSGAESKKEYSVVRKVAGEPSVNNGDKNILLKHNNGTPYYIDRDVMDNLSKTIGKYTPGMTVIDRAFAFFELHKDLFLINTPRSEMKLVSSTTSGDGKHHIRFQQMYDGIPVSGQQLVIHTDNNGIPYSFNGRYIPTPFSLNVRELAFDENEAITKALEQLSKSVTIVKNDEFMKRFLEYTEPCSELTVWVSPVNSEARTAWRISIRPNLKDAWEFFIDTGTGEILDSYNTTAWQTHTTASALDALGVQRIINVALENNQYYMMDIHAKLATYDAHGQKISQFNSPLLVESSDNKWTDPISVSAHANARTVYDYFRNEHGYIGIDGEEKELPLIVHYTEDGTPCYNAFWNGYYIAFGDGQPYAAALDVVAHEYTHGIVEHTVGLEYRFQSGAVNEAYADVMAVMIDPDWQIAEDIPDGPLRDISDPSTYGFPEHMDEYQELPLSTDYGGVHINSSIPAKAGYLMAETIGRDKTADIWFYILECDYLVPRSEFIDLRHAALRAADDLYGEESDESIATAKAFDDVGIHGGSDPEIPDDNEPVTGDEMYAFISTAGNSSRLVLIEVDNPDNIMYLASVDIYTQSSNPMTVGNNGRTLMYIDFKNNIRMIDLDNNEETLIDESGYWSSVKLSPDGSLLAATTIYPDSTLYLIDIEEPEKSTSFHLYMASSEGAKNYNTLYADALDWDRNSTTVLYDAKHSISLGDGTTVEFWDVNLLDVGTGIITRVSTPVDQNTQIGNPSFAETNDRYIVCDLYSQEQRISRFVTIDLKENAMNVLRDNGMVGFNAPNLGHPKYSPDDSSVIFHQYDQFYSTDVIYTMQLNDDKMTAKSKEVARYYGTLPLWFSRGTEPVIVEDSSTSYPETFSLEQNYPNPFNPVTEIPFTLTEPAYVTLSVYDILGRRVGFLIDKEMIPGGHSVLFDASGLASGIYIYRLRVGGKILGKKMTVMK